MTTQARTTMTMRAAAVTAVLIGLGSTAAAQSSQPKPPEVPVKVDVVLTRYQGDRKISSLPFSMLVMETSRSNYTNLRVGVDVPIGTRTETESTGANHENSTSTTTPQYRNIGTSIDCQVGPIDDGRLSVHVSLTDSAIFDPGAQRQTQLASQGIIPQSAASSVKASDAAAFRTFLLSNTLPMRDGQTLEFATAADKITGEVLKMDVTVAVVK